MRDVPGSQPITQNLQGVWMFRRCEDQVSAESVSGREVVEPVDQEGIYVSILVPKQHRDKLSQIAARNNCSHDEIAKHIFSWALQQIR